MSQPKQRRIEEPRDPEHWMRWLEKLFSWDESPICESDEDVVDSTERSDHETGTDLTISDQEIELDNSSEYSGSDFCLGKDKVIGKGRHARWQLKLNA
nr:unnamed protein product [Callosobruchus analis]